jgi:hypothetical protein
MAANGENLGQPVLIRSIVQAGIWRSISKEQGIYHLFANGELVELQTIYKGGYGNTTNRQSYLMPTCYSRVIR